MTKDQFEAETEEHFEDNPTMSPLQLLEDSLTEVNHFPYTST